MTYFNSVAPLPEFIDEILDFMLDWIAEKDVGFINLQTKTNRHELQDYRSIEVYWLNGEEYDSLELDSEDGELDEEQKKRYEELENQIDVMNELDSAVSKKFEHAL